MSSRGRGCDYRAIGAARRVHGAAHTLRYLVEALPVRLPHEAVHAIGETVLMLFSDDGGAFGARDDVRAGTLWLRGTIQRSLGRAEDACASLTESLRLFEVLRRVEEVKTIRRELALLAVESDDLATAREYLAVLRESSDSHRVLTGF